MFETVIPCEKVADYIALCSLVHPDERQGWKLEFFEIEGPIPSHYHKIQRQFILSVGGKMKVLIEDQSIDLNCGELACVEPGAFHSLIPEEKAQFLAIDLPGFVFPDDVYSDPLSNPLSGGIKPVPWMRESSTEPLPPFERAKIELDGYGVYELVQGAATGKRWSAALLEISDSPRHYHRNEKEFFIVVNGDLDIEIGNQREHLAQGESICIHPGNVHKLRSRYKDPVRVLCFSFPAFDPSDMVCLE